MGAVRGVSRLGSGGTAVRRAAPGRAPRAGRWAPRPRALVPEVGAGTGGDLERPVYADENLAVVIDAETDPAYTVITINATQRPGILQAITDTFKDLGLSVYKADVDTEGDLVRDTFRVTDSTNEKVTDEADLQNIELCLTTMLDTHFQMHGAAARPKQESTTSDIVDRRKKELLYGLMDSYIKNDVLSVQESIVNHVEYTIGRSRYRFDDNEAYQATAHSVRDRLIESWNDTHQHFRDTDPKRVYYLSMEFLMGRTLTNALYNLDVKEQYEEALRQLGYDLEKLVEVERDAALGNGGLGRLAACFLDSMATLNLPAWGYGLRYQFGMFRQVLNDGFQHESPDYWLNFGNPWEIERPNVAYSVKFYGHVSTSHDEDGRQMFHWNAGEEAIAVAYDTPVPGWNTPNTINLRLWSAKPQREFDLESFNTGDYVSAILSKQRAETITHVLYPDDRTHQGKELRLKQQFFLVSATLQDILRRYKEQHPEGWDEFPEKVALQLNDTHPTLGVPELMRLLMDEEKLGWTKSWELVTKVFAYTNHTVLPEALEKWPVHLVEQLLPRHMQIIFDINWRFMQELRDTFPGDTARHARMSIIEESDGGKSVRMAHLALVASHTVNGVAAIHSELIKETIFKDFVDIMPGKFQNKTNGVTQRRWLAFCNPLLSNLITSTLGSEAWKSELDALQGLKDFADDEDFQEQWAAVKKANKENLAAKVLLKTGIELNTDAMFDVQVKRIHEYKRQLLNVLSIIHRYNEIKAMAPKDRKKVVPRVCIIGGKAAPGYDMAKRIIKLIGAVGDKVNNDPDVGDLLKVVFFPDYNVSSAEYLIPGAELSQHISTAGTEASGTSNMKFALNGSLIIGTMDGANVEIAKEIGKSNMFIFGVEADQVPRLRAERHSYQPAPEFNEVVDQIRSGFFGWADYFAPVVNNITDVDYYLLANDFKSYLDAQEAADKAYKNQKKWTKMSILSTAASGFFSSDRTIAQYATDIWNVKACKRPSPGAPAEEKSA